MVVSERARSRASRWAAVQGLALSGGGLDRVAGRLSARRRARVVVVGGTVAASAFVVWQAPPLSDLGLSAWVFVGFGLIALGADVATSQWRDRAARWIDAGPQRRVARASRLGLVDALGRRCAALVAATLASWIAVTVVAITSTPVTVATAWLATAAVGATHVAFVARRLVVAAAAGSTAAEIAVDDILRVLDVRDGVGSALCMPAVVAGTIAGTVSAAGDTDVTAALVLGCAALTFVAVIGLDAFGPPASSVAVTERGGAVT